MKWIQTHPAASAERNMKVGHVLNADFYVYAVRKTCVERIVSWGFVFCFFVFVRGARRAEHGHQRAKKVKSNLPTGGRAASEHNPSRCWLFHSTRRAWAAAAGPSLWRRGYRSPDARRPLPWWWPDLQTCFSLSPSKRRSLFFCKYPHFHARAVSSVHRAGARSPENGDKDHAGVRGCATHHTLEMKFCLPLQKKYQTRERVGAATQRWRRDPGGGLTSDVRHQTTCIYAQYW